MALKVATPRLILYVKARAIEHVFASLNILDTFLYLVSVLFAVPFLLHFSTCTCSTVCECKVVLLDVLLCVCLAVANSVY